MFTAFWQNQQASLETRNCIAANYLLTDHMFVEVLPCLHLALNQTAPIMHFLPFDQT